MTDACVHRRICKLLCYFLEIPWWLNGKESTLPVQETQVRSLGQEDPLEKEMATHSSVLAWRIPGTREPGGLPSTGSHRVKYDQSDLAAAALTL